jgi:hypothetical protein
MRVSPPATPTQRSFTSSELASKALAPVRVSRALGEVTAPKQSVGKRRATRGSISLDPGNLSLAASRREPCGNSSESAQPTPITSLRRFQGHVDSVVGVTIVQLHPELG